MKTALLRTFALLLALSLAALTSARAEDLSAIRARMEQRIAQIDALKTQGALGENNRGFLEVRASAAEADALASAENKDRTAVYEAIAARTNATADSVARARARQIAANSAAGVWLQRDSGEWYKK
jgi:uncharacterized protein